MNNIINLAEWKATKAAATKTTTATEVTVASSTNLVDAAAAVAATQSVASEVAWKRQWEAGLAAAKSATKMSAMGAMKLGRKLRS